MHAGLEVCMVKYGHEKLDRKSIVYPSSPSDEREHVYYSTARYCIEELLYGGRPVRVPLSRAPRSRLSRRSNFSNHTTHLPPCIASSATNIARSPQVFPFSSNTQTQDLNLLQHDNTTTRKRKHEKSSSSKPGAESASERVLKDTQPTIFHQT